MSTETVISETSERMTYKPSELIKSLPLKPMPGRFFFRPIPLNKLDVKRGGKIFIPPGKKKGNSITEFESRYYEHPDQIVVIAVGASFNRGKEYKEKMVVKKGDILYFGESNARVFMYRGVAFMEGVQSAVIAIAGNVGNDFTILDPVEDK